MLLKLYDAAEIRSRLKFLVEMRNKGISSDSYQGNQVVFRSRADLSAEIDLYDAADECIVKGVQPVGSGRAFRVLDGFGLRTEGDFR
jgi:hypothetical protein